MFRSLDAQKTLPELYENTLGGNGGPKWDFGQYAPHAVVINLGTNDKNAGGADDTFRESFKRTYTTFLDLLRGHYPEAQIYCASQDGAMATEIQAVVAANNDPKLEFLALDGNNGKGCDGHPDLEGHQHIAETLTAALKADLGW